jgi:TRAP-type C4-dicarboxylate transport system substrate-binding protein
MKRKLLSISVLFITILFFVGNGVYAATTTWTLKVNTMAGAADRGCTILGAWYLMDRIEMETKGRIKYKKFPGSQLARPPEVPIALQKGVIDVHFTGGVSFYTGVAPEIGFNMVPGVIDTWEVADRLVKHPEVIQIMDRAWNKTNGHWLGYVPGPGQMYFLNKEIKTLNDFKQLKLGSSGGMFDKFANLLGAAVVTVPPAERFTALQNKTIDGITGMFFGLEDYKWGEVIKYAVVPQILVPNVYGAVIRKDLWSEFPDDIKEAVDRACQWHWLFMKDWITNYLDKFEDPLSIKKYGVKIVNLSSSDRVKYQKAFEEMENVFAQQSPECKQLIEIYRKDLKKYKSVGELIKDEKSRYREYGIK